MRFLSALLILAFLIQTACSSSFEPGLISEDQEQDKIVGGVEVKANDPKSSFVVMIYGESNDGVPYICTGSFISNNTILTAAHCVVEDISKMSVAFSVNPMSDPNAKILDIKSVIQHQKYSPEAIIFKDRNDLALIKFSGGLPDGGRIAKLPTEKYLLKGLFSISALGYGRTEGLEDSSEEQNEIGILRAVNLKFNNFEFKEKYIVLDQLSGKGVCFGDSGGPLVSIQKSNHVLLGVASAVVDFQISSKNKKEKINENDLDFCHKNSVYMNLKYYLPWILKNLY